jgi:hypothetical protein
MMHLVLMAQAAESQALELVHQSVVI